MGVPRADASERAPGHGAPATKTPSSRSAIGQRGAPTQGASASNGAAAPMVAIPPHRPGTPSFGSVRQKREQANRAPILAGAISEFKATSPCSTGGCIRNRSRRAATRSRHRPAAEADSERRRPARQARSDTVRRPRSFDVVLMLYSTAVKSWGESTSAPIDPRNRARATLSQREARRCMSVKRRARSSCPAG